MGEEDGGGGDASDAGDAGDAGDSGYDGNDGEDDGGCDGSDGDHGYYSDGEYEDRDDAAFLQFVFGAGLPFLIMATLLSSA